MEPRFCIKCGILSGTSLVCGNCRRYLTDSEHKKLTELWHTCVVMKGYDPQRKQFQCHHCGKWFPRNKVCGDHFPVTKGSCEAIRFDVAAGQPACSACNTSGNKHRQESLRTLERRPVCKECHFLLVARDDLCYRCLQLRDLP